MHEKDVTPPGAGVREWEIQVAIQEPLIGEVSRAVILQEPDVVLVDIDQSGGRGLEIIREVRRLCRNRTPVIMALAGSTSIQYRASSIDAGAMYFFNQLHEMDWLVRSLTSLHEQLEEIEG